MPRASTATCAAWSLASALRNGDQQNFFDSGLSFLYATSLFDATAFVRDQERQPHSNERSLAGKRRSSWTTRLQAKAARGSASHCRQRLPLCARLHSCPRNENFERDATCRRDGGSPSRRSEPGLRLSRERPRRGAAARAPAARTRRARVLTPAKEPLLHRMPQPKRRRSSPQSVGTDARALRVRALPSAYAASLSRDKPRRSASVLHA
jgi:hypothetical protein